MLSRSDCCIKGDVVGDSRDSFLISGIVSEAETGVNGVVSDECVVCKPDSGTPCSGVSEAIVVCGLVRELLSTPFCKPLLTAECGDLRDAAGGDLCWPFVALCEAPVRVEVFRVGCVYVDICVHAFVVSVDVCLGVNVAIRLGVRASGLVTCVYVDTCVHASEGVCVVCVDVCVVD